MANPVVVEATRGKRIESAHRGAGAVVDADGRVVMAFGDAEHAVYPRSAVKALQALPLVESGAADRLGLSEKEIALSCASHSGSDDHLATARSMLAKVGYDEQALECGAHWPLGEDEARALARSGRTPTALHNNCSGKHAGFVCLSCAMGVEPKNYVAPDHPVQREVAASLQHALEVRRERILISRSEVNGVKWFCLAFLALCLLFAIAFVHCDNRLTSAVAIGLFSAALATTVLLILSHDRPFTGEIALTPEPLLQVMPEIQ